MRTDRLIGGDFSHHNTVIPKGLSFYFLKATEGKLWRDSTMEENMKCVWDEENPPIYGFYHFARPQNGNSHQDEAKNYLEKIKPHIGQCLMALDVELDAVKYPQWCINWLKYVYEETGVKPFIYASGSILQQWKASKNPILDFPIWIAHYGTEQSYSQFKIDSSIWQFTSTPFDLDYFYGDKVQLARFAMKEPPF